MGILRSSIALRTLATLVGLVSVGGCYGRGGDTCRQDSNCRSGYACCPAEGESSLTGGAFGVCHKQCPVPVVSGSDAGSDAGSSDAATDAGDGG